MAKDLHVQMLVDVLVPGGKDQFVDLTKIIELINAFLQREGMEETVWVARLPEDR